VTLLLVVFVSALVADVGAGVGGEELVGANGQVELPAGPNRDVVYRKCASCHDLQNLVDTKGLSRENWNGTIDEMVTYGMNITPDEREQVLGYLATYLPPGR